MRRKSNGFLGLVLASKTEGFGNVIFVYLLGRFEVGNSAGNFDDFEVGAGGKLEICGRGF